MKPLTLIPGAEPFYYPGSAEVGCLVLHGLTGAPQEVRWLGQFLCQQGYTAHGPLLAGHGTRVDDLARTTWRDWYASALSGYAMLKAHCERVYVMGLSLGGALALLLAANEPVDGVVAMAAPHRVVHPFVPLIPLISVLGPIFRQIAKSTTQEEYDEFQAMIKAEQARRGETPTGNPSYRFWPTSSVGQLDQALALLRESLPRITAPALLMHSTQDQTVPFADLDRNYQALGSVDKEKVVYQQSGHILPCEMERDAVFARIETFIEAHR
jgi:carboxylesterase